MKILIAEDNITTLTLLKKLIEKMGHKCDLSSDGLDAWDKMKNGRYRMLITDWMMPGLDGVTLLRRIRETDFKEYVYIILLTGKTEEGDIIDGLESGADDYIKKPFNKDELKARIRAGSRILELHDENTKVHTRMMESGKLVAIGNLAQGISHEINTPAQYIINNSNFLEDAFGDCLKIFEEYGKLLNAVKSGGQTEDLVLRIEEVIKEYDFDYLKEEIPFALKQNLSGLHKIAKIVKSMKSFAKPSVKNVSVDINTEIENTVTVSTNEWKNIADIEFIPDYDLPLVLCYPGELNQVFLEMIINASNAIGERYKGSQKGKIVITTKKKGDNCEIRISDDGCGIPEKIKTQIYDPFFTTKEVGRGTGQGLATVNSVVTDIHKGSISFDTEINKGTCFTISIPIAGGE